MILTFLLGALVAAALLQPTATRFIGATAFVIAAWSHELFFRDLEGLAYHGTAAISALIVIITTSRLAHISPTIIRLHQVCIASIAVNFAGWIAWLTYLPPEPYNTAIAVVFVWALITLIGGEGADVGTDSMDCRRPGLHFYSDASFQPSSVSGVKE